MKGLWALSLLLLAPAIFAAELQVRVIDASTQKTCSGGVVVATGHETTVRVPVAGAATSLTVPEGDSWQVRVESASCWSETANWLPGDASTEVRVYARASVGGTFDLKADEPPDVKAVLFAPEEQPLDCVFALPKWRCSVPAELKFDLRVHAAEFAPEYFWDLVAKPASEVGLEPRTLRPGASVAGWVRNTAGDALAAADVHLEPLEERADRIEARRTTVRTNKRGFFQFAGVDAGAYQVAAEARDLSPASVPITVRASEGLVLPRAVTLPPYARLELTLDPPLDDDGKPWVVELEPALFTNRRPPLSRPAIDGRWTAERLRAARYRVSVRTENSTLRSEEIDLSDGGSTARLLTIERIRVRGRLLMGDRGLKAQLWFSNGGFTVVRADTSETGDFEAVFPRAGKWRPEVRYPPGRSAAMLRAKPIEIPEEVKSASIDIVLDGGRIRGTVVSPDGKPAAGAAVHATRERRMGSQQLTNDAGEFDLVGLPPGTYMLDADGESGVIAPVEVVLAEDETKTVRLVLEPYQMFRGVVLTPHATPASGAVVRVYGEGAPGARVVTDVHGRFMHRMYRGAPTLTVVVNTYAYPSTVISAPAEQREPLVIRLRPEGGLLRVRSATDATVWTRGARVPISFLWFPEPFGRFNGAAHLEPGGYTVCPALVLDDTCRPVVIAPGAEQSVDFEETKK